MLIDRPHIGILLMLGFCLLAPLGDAVAKLLVQSLPIAQLVFFRFLVQAILLIPLVLFTRRPWRMRGQVLKLAALRTLFHILGIGLMVAALRYMPLADAVAIAFVMPFILLVLSKLFLDEEIGKRRILASLVGFAGTLLVIQPSFAQVGWAALLPLAVAVIFSLFMLVTRRIAKETDPLALQAVSGVFAVLLLGPLLLAGAVAKIGPLGMVAPGNVEWVLLLAIGGIGTLAHLLMTWSLRYAPAATLAPMQYLEIPAAALLGWLIFHDWPNAMAFAGILVTIAAGLYIAITEKASAASPDRSASERQQKAAAPAR